MKLSDNRLKICIVLVTVLGLHNGCTKNWLDEKPDLSLVVPTKIADYQSLLDNTGTSIGSSTVGGPVGFNIDQISSNETGADDFFVVDATFLGADVAEQNVYTWGNDIYVGLTTSTEWNTAYKKIYYANIIAEGIDKIEPLNSSEEIAWNQVKGSALFFRAYNHFEMAQLYCKPYDKVTASSDLGIPLRLESNINIEPSRSTVQETYGAIIADLKAAKEILPVITSSNTLYKLRPTKNAATAMLARVYLAMANYDSAFRYSDIALGQYNVLMDYNTDINPAPNYIPRFNPEVIFHTTCTRFYLSFFPSRAVVDPAVYNLYDANDWRRDVFFYNFLARRRFRGGYDNGSNFTGLATDEVFLIRSECYARAGNKDMALQDLNALIRKRWINSVPYPEITAGSSEEALQKILIERRKELYFRGLRWSDLRRLNKEPQFAITLNRSVNGQTYTLPPNDPRYVLPIPPDVIRLSNMPQNPR